MFLEILGAIGAILGANEAEAKGEELEDDFNRHHNGPDRQHQKNMVAKEKEIRRRKTI